jgi:hypothetical protein
MKCVGLCGGAILLHDMSDCTQHNGFGTWCNHSVGEMLKNTHSVRILHPPVFMYCTVKEHLSRHRFTRDEEVNRDVIK